MFTQDADIDCMHSECACVQGVPTYRHLVSNLFEVDAAHEIHLAAVNLEDVKAGTLIGIGEFNLPVNSAWPEQSCI